MSLVKKYRDFLAEGKSFKSFFSGVGKGIKDLADETVFSSKDGKKTQDKNTILNSAKNIRYSIESIASEVDNLIAANKQIRGENAQNSEIKSLQNRLREIYKYVVTEINDDLSKGGSFSGIEKKLDGYSSELEKIQKEELKSLKEDILGKNLEKFTASEFLSKGRELIEQAKEILNDLVRIKYVDEIRKSYEPEGVIKRALGDEKDSKNKKKSKIKDNKQKSKVYKTFSKTPKESDADTIGRYQERLKSIGYLENYEKGKYDDKTKAGEKKAMHFIGKLSGKNYTDDDAGFALFQRDLARYVDYKKEN